MDIKFTMVMDEELARKMSYIGKYYGRSRIKEIEWACKQYVQDFEENIDKIRISEQKPPPPSTGWRGLSSPISRSVPQGIPQRPRRPAK